MREHNKEEPSNHRFHDCIVASDCALFNKQPAFVCRGLRLVVA